MGPKRTGPKRLWRAAMSRRRRRVFIETQKGRRSAGFTVHEGADAADVSLALRNRG